MNEPIWLERLWVDRFHYRQLHRHGGRYGIRDDGAIESAIESAIARPRQKWAYADEPNLASLAAAYGFGLVKNYGYVDGNKRVGFVATAVFLELNGLLLEADEAEVVVVVTAVKDGSMSEDDLAAWVADHVVPAQVEPPV